MDRAYRRAMLKGFADANEKVTLEMVLGDRHQATRERVASAVLDALEGIGIPTEIASVAQKVMRSPEIQTAVRKRLDEEIETLVRAEVAKRVDELEARVRTAVAERFEEQVAAAARRLLDEEIEKIRRRFV